jgi:hypothetical protein
VAVAAVHAALFVAGVVTTAVLTGGGHIPAPYEPQERVTEFLVQSARAVGIGGLCQFGSAIPLGIFTATVVSRLRFLGSRAAGPSISQFGGYAAATLLMMTGILQVLMSRPAFAGDPSVLRACHWLTYATGGPGIVVPLGLLFAGVSISAGIARWIPRWLMIFGLILAVLAECSTLSLLFDPAVPLLPLARFPGFVWMIGAGYYLPRSIQRAARGGGGDHLSSVGGEAA